MSATNRIAPYLDASTGVRPPFFLVAEDDPDDQFLLRQAFQVVCGDEVELGFVEDGLALLEHLERCAADGQLPDYLLLDLRLPKLDGLGALAEIRRRPTLCELPVIVLTSSSASTDRDAVEALAAIEFMTKPDDFDDLTGFLSRLVRYYYKTAA